MGEAWDRTPVDTVLRVVSTISLHVQRKDDDSVLVQIGKFRDGMPVAGPGIKMPGFKMVSGEMPDKALGRFVSDAMPGLQETCTMIHREVRVEVKDQDSGKYGVQTKYVQRIYHYSLDTDAEGWNQLNVDELQLADVGTASSTLARGDGDNVALPSIRAFTMQTNELSDVGHEQAILAWLSPEAVTEEREATAAALKAWVPRLQRKAGLIQRISLSSLGSSQCSF